MTFGSKGNPLIGLIVMWSGAIVDIPKGWHLCDGTDGTPDLRDRFMLGAGLSVAPGDIGGSLLHNHLASADPDEHTHVGTAQNDQHNHTGSAAADEHDHTATCNWDTHGHSHSMGNRTVELTTGTHILLSSPDGTFSYSSGQHKHTLYAGTDMHQHTIVPQPDTHDHSVEIDNDTHSHVVDVAGDSHEHDVTVNNAGGPQPYYGLCFIIKV